MSSVFQKKAEGIATVADLYTLKRRILASKSEWSPYELDAIWVPVEARLSSAIDVIISSSHMDLDAKLWLYVLVEFATQIFVRGNDFGARFAERFPDELRRLFDVATPDHVNGARLLELHRLRGAVLSAKWTVLHAHDGRLITNDIGRTHIAPDSTGRIGYVIPLRFDAALALTFTPSHRPMTLHPHADDRWVVGPVEHESLDEQDVANLNEALARSAIKEIYGAPQRTVDELRAQMSSESPPLVAAEPTFLLPFRDLGDTRAHERLWLLVATPPSQCLVDQEVTPPLR